MSPEKCKKIVDGLIDSIYADVELEVLKNLNLFITTDKKNNVILSFGISSTLKEVTALSLFREIKASCENSDDPRNQIGMAIGLEKIAKWCRDDASRLEKEQG